MGSTPILIMVSHRVKRSLVPASASRKDKKIQHFGSSAYIIFLKRGKSINTCNKVSLPCSESSLLMSLMAVKMTSFFDCKNGTKMVVVGS